MNNLSLLFFMTAFLFSACNGKTEKKATESTAKDSIPAKTVKEISIAKTDFLADLPVQDLPIIDSTSFDNFEKFGMLDNGFLKRVKFDPGCKDAANFRLNYKIPFSDNFTSVVVTYQCGEHELFTTLLTPVNSLNLPVCYFRTIIFRVVNGSASGVFRFFTLFHQNTQTGFHPGGYIRKPLPLHRHPLYGLQLNRHVC